MKTPVVFIIFKRPDTTEKVFEVIRQVQPPKLLVIADGPRADQPGEAEKCAATRAIIDQVDWNCEVLKNYADVNMGLKSRVSTGLDWVFSLVEDAIILEDDCSPDPSFFRFCEELLEKYRYDQRVWMICGSNLLGEYKSHLQSYCFSYHSHCWGWATWKRAWQHYDVNMKLWSNPEIQSRIRDVVGNEQQYDTYKKQFDRVFSGELNTSWALPWLCLRLSQSALSIIPAINLISNIGFNPEGSNTRFLDDSRANLPLQSMSFPLREPAGFARDRGYELGRYQRHVLDNKKLGMRISRKIKRILFK
ncbi:MAG: glycosyltransferase family 2 protein [Coleofasciculus sp. C1-SOL-03]|jgi:hypothetical protein|uniref:glycosyltransferase family 2 protein n=1 Tax=Coleofasciculus sp. C1-SOL-03 TaxID=3069522 RepID=UPI0032FBFDC1